MTTPTIRIENDREIYADTIAQGRISVGGYVGPDVVVPCEIGWTTTVIDPGYHGGLRIDIRVVGVDDTHVAIEGRVGDATVFGRCNPLTRIERSRVRGKTEIYQSAGHHLYADGSWVYTVTSGDAEWTNGGYATRERAEAAARKVVEGLQA